MPTENLTTHPDPALFLDFLDPNLSLLDLADRHALALDDLLDWSEHPETHQRLTRLHTLLTLRNSFLAAEKLPIALTSLTVAATQTAPPDADPALAHRTTESARRAATQLARLASLAPAKGRPPLAAAQPATTPPSRADVPAPAVEVTPPDHHAPVESAGAQNPGTAVPGFSAPHSEARTDDLANAPVHTLESPDAADADTRSDLPAESPSGPYPNPSLAAPPTVPHPLSSPILPATPPARAAAHHAWP